MLSSLLLVVVVLVVLVNVNSFNIIRSSFLSSSSLMSQKIDIISKEILITEPLKNRINEKVGKVIDKLGSPNLVNSAHVTLRLHKNNPNENHSQSTKKDSQITEVTLRMKGGRVLHASERTDDMYASIDLASHKIAKKLKTYKEKVKEKHAKDVEKDTNAFFDESELIVTLDEKYKDLAKISDIFTVYPHKVQMKQFEMPSLTLNEATEQLLMTEFEFFMFKNVDKGLELNVVYRRKSGGVGCIVPQQN